MSLPPAKLPRFVLAAPGSGHGKTTVATGLLAAYRAEGLEVQGFKVGPDYIDPGYHALATGRPGRNLDPHLCRPDQLLPLLRHGVSHPRPADLAVIEGVMGLFDGHIGRDGYASTAHVAGLVQAPVVLVVDVSHTSRTVAALVHGLTTFDPAVRIAGVILNQVGSARHDGEVRSALEATGVPVLGALPRDLELSVPSRHLGLIPATEQPGAAAAVARLGKQVGEHVDLAAVLAVAHGAPAVDVPAWDPGEVVSPPGPARPVVAVAEGRAFTFRYAETDELLRAAGCEPVVFDPLRDPALPAGTAGLYLGGGFPQVHPSELAGNQALRAEIAAAVGAGLPTVAECAGLLYLCRALDQTPMLGAVAADAEMTSRLTLRYVTAVTDHEHLLGFPGLRVTGHEFHRTAVTPESGERPAWLVDGRPMGFATDTLHASYLHVHWAGHPQLAQRFAEAVHAYVGRQEPGRDPALWHDLAHHGDRDAEPGLVDLAVNVRLPGPPDWLAAIIRDSVARLGCYPRPEEARAVIARHHRVAPEAVLPTAGAAEAFTLVARAFGARRALVVHPQFSEPEAALRAAGTVPARLLLDPDTGFALDPAAVDPGAELVAVSNPTNPTGALHPAAALRSLVRSGRILVVDEAFMDAVPGEPETLLGGSLTGVLMVRSLTKTWGLAGLRAGYVVGDPDLIAAVARQQPPWSVSTPALAATAACLTPEATAEAADAAQEIAGRREALVAGLARLGLRVAGEPRTPYVLVDTRDWAGRRASGSVRADLRARGFAVRRGETFPGLDADWIRIAVRDEATTQALLAALDGVRDKAMRGAA